MEFLEIMIDYVVICHGSESLNVERKTLLAASGLFLKEKYFPLNMGFCYTHIKWCDWQVTLKMCTYVEVLGKIKVLPKTWISLNRCWNNKLLIKILCNQTVNLDVIYLYNSWGTALRVSKAKFFSIVGSFAVNDCSTIS